MELCDYGGLPGIRHFPVTRNPALFDTPVQDIVYDRFPLIPARNAVFGPVGSTVPHVFNRSSIIALPGWQSGNDGYETRGYSICRMALCFIQYRFRMGTINSGSLKSGPPVTIILNRDDPSIPRGHTVHFMRWT